MRFLVLLTPKPGWECSAVPALLPGGHAIVVGHAQTAIDGRKAGLELRDTLTIFSPGYTRLAFLFRKPFSEQTVVAQLLATGTGALNVDACRVGTSKPMVKNIAFGSWRELEGRSDRQCPEQTYDPNVGRWPTNLVFVHGPWCRQFWEESVWQCAADCPVFALSRQVEATGDAYWFFPQFKDDDELFAWMARLLNPPV